MSRVIDINSSIDHLNLKTGDILLFDDRSKTCLGCWNRILKCYTRSRYSHVAMVLKSPTYIDSSLTGTYIWESSWEGKPDPQDNKIKLGVQITPIEQILEEYLNTNSYVFLRRLNVPEGLITPEKLVDIHRVVYDKPYDTSLIDWIGEIVGKDFNPRRTKSFWCSALVGYIYTQLGILQKDTDWSFLRQADFSIKYQENLFFNPGCSLENAEIQIIP